MGETYDVWTDGWPVHTGIPDYDLARRAAVWYSGGSPLLMFSIYYSGAYGTPGKMPRPLAIFMCGCQLPCPIRLTAPGWIDVRPEYPAFVYEKLEVSINPLEEGSTDGRRAKVGQKLAQLRQRQLRRGSRAA